MRSFVVGILPVPGISTVVGVPAVFTIHAVVGVSAIVGILLLLASLNNLTEFLVFFALNCSPQILTVSLPCKISEETHFFWLCSEMISLPSRPFRFGTESEQLTL